MQTTLGLVLDVRRGVTIFFSMSVSPSPFPAPMAFCSPNPVNSFGIFGLQVLIEVVQKRMLASTNFVSFYDKLGILQVILVLATESPC